MMKIKVAASSINTTPLDWAGNYNKIIKTISEAKNNSVDFLCLPELCITGYGCEDAFFYNFVLEKAFEQVTKLKKHTEGIVVAVGFPFAVEGAIYNCVAVLYNNEIVGIVPKQNLSSDGVHYEKRWFKEWPKGAVVEIDDLTIGDLVFNFDTVCLGFEICEDAWVAERPGINLFKRGVNLIFNPSASHFSFDKYKTRQNFISEGSRAFKCVYVYSNLVGNESGRLIFGGDMYIAQNGAILASNTKTILQDNSLITSVVDLDECFSNKNQTASFNPNLENSDTIFRSLDWKKHHLDRKNNCIINPGNKFRQFEDAVTIGLYDYMRKSKSSGYVVSLSGGIDSAACAFLVSMMAEISGLKTENLLTCIYQKTKNSSEVTENNARNLAQALGAKYHCIDVEPLVEQYTNLSENILGRKLTWEKDDIALQNIQARVRSPSVWMVANVKNAILISTSNRSEAAVGYATLDGDTCGGLSPIAGIDKMFLINWFKDLQETVLNDKIKEALKAIVETKPTAELRPLEQNQEDENDLMPYSYLDIIERLAIHKKKSPADVLEHLSDIRPGREAEQKKYVEKFFKLWSRNQYKRERYAVSFHLDDANLDPKSWCRFPVLNSGFKEELDKL